MRDLIQESVEMPFAEDQSPNASGASRWKKWHDHPCPIEHLDLPDACAEIIGDLLIGNGIFDILLQYFNLADRKGQQTSLSVGRALRCQAQLCQKPRQSLAMDAESFAKADDGMQAALRDLFAKQASPFAIGIWERT